MSHLSEQPHRISEVPSEWFRRAFDTLYPLIYQHRNDESAKHEIAALIRTLNVRAGSRIIDIACGAGRHLRALRDAGYEVMGMDLSMTLLREAVTMRGLRGRVVRGDVRAIPFAGQFDMATNLFNSFGYFADDEENFAALRSMASVLRTGGLLVMDHMNPRKVQTELVAHDVKSIGELSVESWRNIEGDRVCKRMVIRHPGEKEEHLTERVRLFSPGELSQWFERAGLRVMRVMGGFDGADMRDDSPRMVMVGVRT